MIVTDIDPSTIQPREPALTFPSSKIFTEKAIVINHFLKKIFSELTCENQDLTRVGKSEDIKNGCVDRRQLHDKML